MVEALGDATLHQFICPSIYHCIAP